MRNLTSLALLIISVTFLAACAPAPIKLTAGTAQKLQGAHVQVIHFEAADFAIMTPTKAMFGAIGGAIGGAAGGVAAVSEGNALVHNDGIDDPAAYIGHSLAEHLGQTYHFAGMTDLPQPHPVKDDDPTYARTVTQAGLVIDVRTYMWSFIYFPTHWTKYQPMYSARARIIDTKTGTIVSQQTCQIKGSDSDTAPTYDEMMTNSGAILKEQIRKAADTCVMQIADKILG